MISTAELSRRLGGLYCLYCLYETQPFKPPFRIYLSLGRFALQNLFQLFLSYLLFIWLIFKFYITGELKKLKALVVEAKEKDIRVVPTLVKRMLDKNIFLFGSVDVNEGSFTETANQLTALQNARVQVAYEKYVMNNFPLVFICYIYPLLVIFPWS